MKMGEGQEGRRTIWKIGNRGTTRALAVGFLAMKYCVDV